MDNDLWYLGNGRWVAYSEDINIIREFKGQKEMRLNATYCHYRKGGIRAAQFIFHQGQELRRGHCLLSYVCARMDLDFVKALDLYRKKDSTPYSQKYFRGSYQIKLFREDCAAPRAGSRAKKTKP